MQRKWHDLWTVLDPNPTRLHGATPFLVIRHVAATIHHTRQVCLRDRQLQHPLRENNACIVSSRTWKRKRTVFPF